MSKKGWSKIQPMARKDNLSFTAVGNETIVYDKLSHQASCLDTLTTTIWNACDGESDTVALLETLCSAGYQDACNEVVILALDQLNKAKLLETLPENSDTHTNVLNRREMLQSLGKRAVLAIPVVSSITIQPAIAGISDECLGRPCPNGASDCCSVHPLCQGGTCGS